MTTPAPTGNAPLLLKELDIPGRSAKPISTNPDVWGINWAAALGNFPLLGLLCRAGPWSTMNIGDRLVVTWGPGQQVVNKTIDKDEVDKTVTVFVPPGRLLDGPVKVSYVVTRLGQVAEPSEVMDVLVKLTIPGGQDTDPGPGHSNFFMFLPKGTVENGIDKDNVADGVDITIGPDPVSGRAYLNAAAGDVILVSWGGVFVSGPPLTQDQADGKAPIIIHVDEATIREAGDSDGVAVAFEVHDKVFNRSEDWSHEQRVPVAIDTTRPAAPLLKQAVSNVLDLDKLGNAEGIAQVMILDSRIAVGDIISVRVKGATTEGVPIDEKMRDEPVVSVPSILEIDIPNALLRRMAKSQLILSYRVQKIDGSPDLQSRSQFISVIGEAQRLLAPKAIEANQGALDPDLQQVRVEIPFDKSFAAGQAIVLFWLGTRPDLTIYLPDLPQHPITQGEVDAKLPIVMIVPGSHLRPINGGTLVLYYQLLTEDQKLRAMNPLHAIHAIRESLRAAPLQIGAPLQELPPPKVDGVVNGVLPADTPGTTLQVLYTQTVADDIVYRQWLGSKTGADSDWVKLTSLTAGKAVSFTIKPELIKGNEGGTVKASYHLERKDGRVSYSQIEEFSVGVKADLQAPRIKEAPDDAMLDPVAAKDKLTALVNYTGMAVNDVITVTFTGAAGTPAGGSHTAAPKTVVTLGEQEIALANSVLAFNLSKGVTVSYTVKQGNAAPIPSPSRPLVVAPLTLGPTYASKILQAANNGDGPELDVSAITTTVRTHSPNWPLIALKQYVWLRFRGTLSSGAAYDKFIFQPPGSVTNPGWVTGDYEYNVPAAVVNEIKGLKHGSSFTVEFKAGLSGSQVEAEAVTFPVRTYTIKAVEDLKPTITRAEDSRGTEIAQGGITADPVVKLTGTAAKGQKVEVFDGTTSKGQATANASGLWELRMTALSVAAHTFRARALYGSNLESEARTLTVTALIAPTLVNVLDAAGTPVPEGGITTSTTLKLSGKASNGQRVEIFDGSGSGAVSKGIATAHATTGDWEHTITVAAGAHRLYAKSLYHGADTFSNVRNLSVTAATAPTLTSVKGLPSNVEIPNGGITVEISAELGGTAAKGQKVEVFDGTTSKGQATADATTGEWRLTVSALSVAAHSFTAKALYGSGAQSGARTFTVVAANAPTLTSVKGLPSNVEIPNGGITVEISAELGGTAAKGQKVEVFDGTTSKGQATANATTGEWRLTVGALSVAAHSFTAKALYGSGAQSGARTLTVTALIPPTLVSVLDAAGKPVLEGGITTSTTLKLSGKASNGQRVEIFDGSGSGAVSKGIATAHATTGDWEHTITVAAGAHRLYAKSLYHSSDTYSDARNLTVTALIAPTLEYVRDSAGTDIPNGGTTYDTTLKVSGKASKGLSVEVFDGNGPSAVSKGTATASATTGDWQLTFTVPLGARRFTALSLYHATPTYSNERILTVAQTVPPTITSVAGYISFIEIPNGSTTQETLVTLVGNSGPREVLYLYNGSTLVGPIQSYDGGGYRFTRLPLNMGTNSFKFVSASGLESNIRTAIRI